MASNPIIKPDIRIVGSESWYNYSLYRGRSVSLKEITKKQKFIFKNPDVYYITDSEDYVFGTENTFDVKYSKECLNDLSSSLHRLYKRCGVPKLSVVVQYFYPSKIFLNSGYLENYFGTFKGSQDTEFILNSWNVDECVFGLKSHNMSVSYNNVKYRCCSGNMVIEDYSF